MGSHRSFLSSIFGFRSSQEETARTANSTGGVRSSTWQDATRSAEAVILTEEAVLVPDYERRQLVNEIILLSGLKKIPESISLIDTHQSGSVNTIIGSVRSFKIEDKKLVGTISLSSKPEVNGIVTDIKEGHLRGVSAGYRRLESVWIEDGKTEEISGRKFTGPVRVVTEWELVEASLASVPADSKASIRSGSKGFSSGDAPANNLLQTDSDSMQSLIRNSVRSALDSDRKFRVQISNELRKFGLPLEHVDTLAQRNTSIEGVRSGILDILSEEQTPVGVGFRAVQTQSQTDKFHKEILAGIASRAFVEIASEVERNKALEEFEVNSNTVQRPLIYYCERYLNYHGVETSRMHQQEIAEAVFNPLSGASGARAYSPAWHTPSSFPALMENISRRILVAAYAEIEPTWRTVFREGPPAQDFRETKRVRVGGLSEPPVWPDNTRMEDVTFSVENISMAVEAYASEFNFSWRTFVNDDLNAFSRIPAMHGRSFARAVNRTAFAELTGNPVMQDGLNLFDPSHNNVGASLAINSTNLGIARASMRKQKGVGGVATLNLQPAILLVPASLESLARDNVNNDFIPDDNKFMVRNQFSNLKVAVEPLLDESSTDRWFLLADSSLIDTVEVVFLAGQQSPVLRQSVDNDTWSRKNQAVQSWQSKAIDYRGIWASHPF